MNKKFLSAVLFGALMVTSTGTFVSCKDYDDDIDRIDKELSEVKGTIASLDAAVKSGKFVQSCNEITGGFELVFSDGTKIFIKNGINGTDGADGTPGLTVIPEFRVEGNYWQYSTDKGATWVDVKDTEGNKVPAKGQDGQTVGSNVSWVTVDGVEYIKIGDKLTDLKQNNEFPNIAVDAETKTVVVTVDGQNYTLLQEGSAFKGLQTVVYRKQYVDENKDICYAYNIKTPSGDLFAFVPAYASFKVYPGEFSLDNAKFSFVDTYQISRSIEPALVYMDGSATLKNGILKLAMIPNEGIDGNPFATSLDVTMYDQYTSASDYFTVSRTTAETTDIKNAFTSIPAEQNGPTFLSDDSWNEYSSDPYGKFDFKGVYNLNDSIDTYLDKNNGVWLKETGISYTKTFRLLDQNEEYDFKGSTIKTHQGIFELKDNVLSVKSDNQASAIDEYAAVEVTTVVKAQKEGVKDYEVKNVVFIKAVRPVVTPEFATVALKPLNSEDDFAFSYSTAEPQIITLDVRHFENAIGGRDVVSRDYSYTAFVELQKPVYDNVEKLTGYISISTRSMNQFWNVSNGRDVTKVADYLVTQNITNEAVLYFKNGGDNADKDSLFLILTPGANQQQYKKMNLLMGRVDGATWNSLNSNYPVNGVSTPFGVYNKYDNKLYQVTVNDFSVTYNFGCKIKDAYKSRVIMGEWTPDAENPTEFVLKSQTFDQMYDIVPGDAQVKFVLDAKKQNEYVKEMMKENNIQWTKNNEIAFTARVDLSKVGTLNVDLYDITFDPYNEDKWELFKPVGDELKWTVQTPVKSFSTLFDLKYNNPALKNGEEIDILALINGIANAADKDKWTKFELKDVLGNKLVSFNGVADQELFKVEAASALYQTDEEESTGIKVELSEADKEEYSYANGILTWNGNPTGTVYEHKVTFVVTYTHDWGVVETKFTVTVSRKAE